MTTSPMEPHEGTDEDDQQVPAGDPGEGGPAQDPGSGEGPQTPPGYPDEVDPEQGPVGGRGAGQLGDLENPGAGPGH